MFTTVYRTFQVADAELVRSRLEAADFHPQIVNDLSALSIDGYTMATGGILVQVPDAEAEAARLLITSSRAASS